ncbi:MAG: NAD-dependent epimerase/dehydratase family protein [Syntrophobacteraceae bacterium]
MKKKVLVCGASGFIGRNLADRLARRSDLQVYGTCFKREPFDHPGINFLRVDLTNPDDVNRAVHGMDVIIQAAATTSGSKDIVTRPYIHVTDNAVMNSLLLRASFEHAVSHVVFFSCSVMYQPSNLPVKESDFNANDELFPSYFGVGWTKIYIEKMCEFYSRIGRTKFTVIRHSNIYGPHDKYDLERSHVFGATVTKIMTNMDGRIVVWGPGTEERDLLYVEDLADFVELAVEKQQSGFELVNVGCSESIAIRDLIQKIIGASGKNVSVEHDLSKPHIPTQLCLDTTRARELFGWAPRHSLDEGIRKTLDWFEGNYCEATD